MLNLMKSELNKRHSGAIAIEYMIVLVVTATTMFSSYQILKPVFTALWLKVLGLVSNTY